MAEQILIVEDEADLAQTIAFNLEKEGYRPIVVGTGSAALERLRSAAPPDLVVLDLMLPDVSGTEVCRQLRQGSETRRIPVLMLTAKTDPIDRVVGFEVGADGIRGSRPVRSARLRLEAVPDAAQRLDVGAREPQLLA